MYLCFPDSPPTTQRKSTFLLRLTLAVLLLLSFLLSSCSPPPRIPVSATFHGQQVTQPVDSEAARYLLEDYKKKSPTNSQLEREIDALFKKYAKRLPSRNELADLSRHYSLDFATLLYADLIYRHPTHRSINREFLANQKKNKLKITNSQSYIILFCPGWDYVESGKITGADLKIARTTATTYGIENHLIPLNPRGTVTANAELIAKSLHKHRHKKIILAAASSSGPATHLALAKLTSPTTLNSVKAWINIGGILQGSPMIDHLQKPPLCYIANLYMKHKGFPKESVKSMRHDINSARFLQLTINQPILIINYTGFPLTSSLSERSKKFYPYMKKYGPNDGLTLLTDTVPPNSQTIISLGNDHFLAEDPHIKQKIKALYSIVFDRLK